MALVALLLGGAGSLPAAAASLGSERPAESGFGRMAAPLHRLSLVSSPALIAGALILLPFTVSTVRRLGRKGTRGRDMQQVPFPMPKQ